MGVEYKILYARAVVDTDIRRIASSWRKKIQNAVERKLTVAPETYGKPLRRSLAGYRKLRVGDYRIIFRIEKNRVKILAIMHRREVYKSLHNRV
ncbi:MAG: type II toxin-antitoxin system RelE/ParE family toxin [Candidatus Paceibacterota bacterium]